MLNIDKNLLIKLVNSGLTIKEITYELSISRSSVTRLYKKYGIKSKFIELKNEELECLECLNKFNGNIKQERKFCSKSCAIKNSNKNRLLTDDTKLKISNTLKNKPKKEKVIKERTCRNCDNSIFKKHKRICDECREIYYQYYRPSSNFDFDINLYKDKFDFSIVKEYGWYSPSNKGNNLGGISKDHLFSVKDGFINNVNTDIIKHPANCRLMIHKENNIKNYNSVITLDELLIRIKEW